MQSARNLRGVETAENQQEEKTFFHPKADEEARRLFKRKNSFYKMMRLPMIYIDKSGFSEDIPRYASAGMRCFGNHDSISKRRTNVIGALTRDRLLTVAIFYGSINAEFF